METIYKVISIMRNNKKNWEIFSKGVKNIAIVCNHIPTTPALINNREKKMNINKMNISDKTIKLMQNATSDYFKNISVIDAKKILLKDFNNTDLPNTEKSFQVIVDQLYLNKVAQ